MRDFFEVFLPIFFIVAFVILTFGGVFVSVDYADCIGFQTTGYETKWKFGCYANVRGEWVPKQYVYGVAAEIRIKEKKQ